MHMRWHMTHKIYILKIAISVLFACYLHTVTQHVTLKQSDVEKLSKIFMFSQTNTKRVSFDIKK